MIVNNNRNRSAEIKYRLQNDIFYFIEKCFGLVPQPMDKRLKERPAIEWTADMFGRKEEIKFEDTYVVNYKWHEFEHKKHLTWQQTKVFKLIQEELDRVIKQKEHNKNAEELGEEVSLEDKIKEKFKLMLAITSARGIGKTAIEAIANCFFFCRTIEVGGMAIAPTGDSGKGTVWGEIDVWLGRMPQAIREMMNGEDIIKTETEIKRRDSTGKSEVSNKYLITRRTTNKENTGAIAGYHAPFVIYSFDEASGIPDDIIDTLMDGFNAYEERFVILISNPRRSAGCSRFEEAILNPEASSFTSFSFSGEESPLRSADENIKILKRNYNRGGRKSSSYLVEALGEYSDDLLAIPDGWLPVCSLANLDIRDDYKSESPFTVFGVDPSGGGDDNATIIARSDDCFKIIADKKYKKTDDSGNPIAHTLIAMDVMGADMMYNPKRIYIDNFGIGASTSELLSSKLGDERVRGYSIGNPLGLMSFDKSKFNTFRSQQIDAFFESVNPSEIGKKKMVLVGSKAQWKNIVNMFYKEDKGRKVYITKPEYKRMGYNSNNLLDACVHTMVDKIKTKKEKESDIQEIRNEYTEESTISYRNLC